MDPYEVDGAALTSVEAVGVWANHKRELSMDCNIMLKSYAP